MDREPRSKKIRFLFFIYFDISVEFMYAFIWGLKRLHSKDTPTLVSALQDVMLLWNESDCSVSCTKQETSLLDEDNFFNNFIWNVTELQKQRVCQINLSDFIFK